MITAKNLLRHELIGLDAEVAESTDLKKVGIQGRIILETKNTLTIKTSKGEKKLPKKECTFIIKLENAKVVVPGNTLVGRPEDRIKK